MNAAVAEPGDAADGAHAPSDRVALHISVMCMMLAAFMVFLDSAVSWVVMPNMQGSLSAARDQITWVATSYIIATAMMLPFLGWLSTRFGRKTIFIVSLGWFTLASALCGAAQTLEQIVLFRILQGASSAGLVPSIMSVIVTHYEGQSRARMMAVYGALSMLGPIAGPIVGGYVTDISSWRWVFYINVPIGIFVIAVVNILYKEPEGGRKSARFDTFGTITLGLAMVFFQLMLDRGTGEDWFGSTEIIIEASLAAIFFYLFLVHWWTTDDTVIPREVILNRMFVIGSVVSMLGLALQLATLALIPPFLQTLANYSVILTALTFVPRGVGAILSVPVGARLMSQVDSRSLLFMGWAFSAWSLWDMAHWTHDVDTVRIGIAFAANGFGLSVLTMNCNYVAFATLRPALTNDASSIYALIRMAGSAALIAFTTIVFTRQSQTMHETLAGHITPFNRALDTGAAMIFLNRNVPSTVERLDHIVNHNAQLIAYSDAYMMLLAVSCLVPLALLFLGKVPLARAKKAPAPTSREAEPAPRAPAE